MEDSAFEAIYTGVYIFIFIAALTTALYMFRNVNELAEKSYEYGTQVTSLSLIEAPEETEYVLTGSDIVAYYFNNTYKDLYTISTVNTDTDTNVIIEYTDNELSKGKLKTYEELLKKINLNSRYKIQCTSFNGSKYTYSISEVK